jgi:hypothetical protein
MTRLFFLLSLLWMLALPLHAQGVVHRCIGGDGQPVFTDQPCAALNASPAVPPPTSKAQATQAAVAPPSLCAGSLDALRQGVIDAFASRDPNRLAALMLWGGYGKQSAVTQIQDLGQLMKRPLLGVTGEDDPDAGAPPDEDEARGPALVIRTAVNDGSGSAQQTRFAIARRSGCLWLLP